MLPVEEFPVQFETFESSRENCDTSPDLSSPVLWISSPRGISSTHYDRSMNLVVGINGTKRWSLWHPREGKDGHRTLVESSISANTS